MITMKHLASIPAHTLIADYDRHEQAYRVYMSDCPQQTIAYDDNEQRITDYAAEHASGILFWR